MARGAVVLPVGSAVLGGWAALEGLLRRGGLDGLFRWSDSFGGRSGSGVYLGVRQGEWLAVMES